MYLDQRTEQSFKKTKRRGRFLMIIGILTWFVVYVVDGSSLTSTKADLFWMMIGICIFLSGALLIYETNRMYDELNHVRWPRTIMFNFKFMIIEPLINKVFKKKKQPQVVKD